MNDCTLEKAAAVVWVWFLDHEIIIRELDARDGVTIAEVLGELHALLRAYSGGRLSVSIDWHAGQGVCRLSISTGGQAKLVPLLEALMERAPRIPGWEITAFLPAHPAFALLRQALTGTGLTPQDLYFCPVQLNHTRIGRKPYLHIYIKGSTVLLHKVKRRIKQFLLYLLGEKIMVKELAGYDVGGCPSTVLQPINLQELPEMLPKIDQIQLEVNEQGRIGLGVKKQSS